MPEGGRRDRAQRCSFLALRCHLSGGPLTRTLGLPCLRHFLRASILEMRKDHEHQLQRLKMLKDQEIDAVTSATSHTRYVCCLALLPKGVLAVPEMRCPDDPPGP